MGTALIKIKLMPSSLETDLEEIKTNSKEILESKQAKEISLEEEPIAFGLKALIISFSIDESIELDPIEQELEKIQNVNSIQVIDMRRAFG